MTKTKSTKRALLMSGLSLLMCVSMLIGTTFAWFTDSVTSGGNKIVAGNLKVDLIHAHYENNQGSATKTSLKENPDHKIFDYALWEPGYTQIEYIQVINQGNLHFEYELLIIPTGEMTELANVIEVYGTNTPSQTHGKDRDEALESMRYLGTIADIMDEGGRIFRANTGGMQMVPGNPVLAYTIALHMKEEAGNEYQGLPLFEQDGGFHLNLVARQMENEFDSFGNDYDRYADYDGEISGEASLVAALTNGGTYKLLSNVTLTESVAVAEGTTVKLDLSGKTLTGNVELAAGSALTVDNGTITNTDSSVSGIQNNGGELVLNDVEISSARHGVRVEGGNVTINGGVYIASGTEGMTQHALNVSDGGTVTIKDGTFVGPNGTVSDSGSAVNVQASSTAIIEGGNFSGGKLKTLTGSGTIIVKGGTFDQDPTAFVAEGYAAIQNADGTYTVMKGVAASTQDALSEALENNAETVVLAAGTYTIPSAVAGKEITLIGSGDSTVVDFTKVNSVSNASITFENLKITGKNENVMNGYGIQSTTGDIVYKNCTFENAITNEFYGNVSYYDCKFVGTYYIATYAVDSATFERCVFDRTDSRALLVYSHGDNPVKVTVKDCEFKAAAKGYTWVPEWTAAVEVDTTNIPSTGTTVTIERCTFDENYNGIVRDKSTSGKENSVITVDGVTVVNTEIKTTGYAG